MSRGGRKPKILDDEQRKYLGLTIRWYKKNKKYRTLVKRFYSSLKTLQSEKRYTKEQFLSKKPQEDTIFYKMVMNCDIIIT